MEQVVVDFDALIAELKQAKCDEANAGVALDRARDALNDASDAWAEAHGRVETALAAIGRAA